MVACVVSFIAGGYGVRDAGVDGGLDGIVQSGRGSTLEAHVRDGRKHAILADPIHRRDDAAVSAVAIAIEHSDGVQRGAVRVLDCNGYGAYSGIIAAMDWISQNRAL